MATIDLGKIKQVWRGTYSSSNTYAVDDLVAYTDSGITSTYIAIAASSNSNQQVPSTNGTATANYWEFVAKGVADPVPTQSGQSGKFLTTNGSAASWATAIPSQSGNAGKALLTDGTTASWGAAGAGKARNLIINGDYIIVQRGETTTGAGFAMDRWQMVQNHADENCVGSRSDIGSGNIAFTAGFRHAFKILNGNQTGLDGTDLVGFKTILEAKDIRNSGWDYLSTSGKITLSFYVKSSVAQAFSGNLRTSDGTTQVYKFDTPSLTANTWTKVTKTIPGSANLQFDNNSGEGLTFHLYGFINTDYTDSNSNTETWVAATSGNYANDMTSTWWATDNATLEITGVQLEVGDSATGFNFVSEHEALLRCRRYYLKLPHNLYGAATNPGHGGNGFGQIINDYPVQMRATPTITYGSIRTTDGLNINVYADRCHIYINHDSPYMNTWMGNAEL